MKDVAVTIYTLSYNTKKYIRKCVESVLNQTFSDFRYLIADNGSTDGTKEILDEYSRRDPRITVVHRHQDAKLDEMLKPYMPSSRYFMTLDSDDYLEPDCLDGMISFAETHQLDVTACGSEFFYEKTGAASYRKLNQDRIWHSQDSLAAELPLWHQFFRTLWGKLFRAELMEQTTLPFRLRFGPDTWWNLHFIRQTRSVGIMEKAYHHYTVRSASYQSIFFESSFDDAETLFVEWNRFLSERRAAAPYNLQFLCRVYSNDCADIVRTLKSAVKAVPRNAANLDDRRTLSEAEKLPFIRSLLEKKNMKNVLVVCSAYEDVVRFKRTAIDFLFPYLKERENAPIPLQTGTVPSSLGEPSPDNQEEVAELLFLLNPEVHRQLEKVDKESKKNFIRQYPQETLHLLLGTGPSSKELAKQLPLNVHTAAVKLSLLKALDQREFVKEGLTALDTPLENSLPDLLKDVASELRKNVLAAEAPDSFIRSFKEMFLLIYEEAYIDALERIVTVFMEEEGAPLSAADRELLLTCGVNLAASTEHTAAFLYLKKELLYLYVGEERWDKAAGVFRDFRDMSDNWAEDFGLDLSREILKRLEADDAAGDK